MKETQAVILTYLSAKGLPPQDSQLMHNQMLKADQPYIHCHSEIMNNE